MTDISSTTAPKSDQLNFDDFIGDKPITIKITKVSLVAGDQPVILNYEGDNGHPYKPGKSMRRVLVHVWGKDGSAYVGRSLTLYGDAKVVFGGMAVGGIRISHMSHIDAAVTMMLTTTRSKRAPFIVKPLAAKPGTENEPAGWRSQLWGAVQAAGLTQDQLVAEFGSLKVLPYSRRGEVESWIQRETVSLSDESIDDIFSDPATCESCGGLLIEGRCHNISCPDGVPAD